MSYFDNQNRIKLLQRDKDGFRAGLFVVRRGRSTQALGHIIRPIIREVRPTVTLFNSGDECVTYHDTYSYDYQVALSQLVEAESQRVHSLGCYGFEVAMEIDDEILIYFCCSKLTRALKTKFSENIGRRIILEPEKTKSGKHTWYRLKIWSEA